MSGVRRHRPGQDGLPLNVHPDAIDRALDSLADLLDEQQLYVGLFDGSGREVSAIGYARKPLTDTVEFSGGAWGTIVSVGLWEQPAGGVPVWRAPLDRSVDTDRSSLEIQINPPLPVNRRAVIQDLCRLRRELGSVGA